MPLLKSLAQQVLAELGVNSAQVQDDIVGEMCRWDGMGWGAGGEGGRWLGWGWGEGNGAGVSPAGVVGLLGWGGVGHKGVR